MTDQIRCFIAIELYEGVKRDLSGAQERLGAILPKELNALVRWVAPESIHLTLKFMGSVPAANVATVQTALQISLAGERSLMIRLKGIGMFPSSTRPSVIWAGMEGELEPLAKLRAKVEAATVPLGFPQEARGFSPHLTLARVRENASGPERLELGRLVAAAAVEIGGEIAVERVSLMRSELRPGGARYSRITAIELESR